MKVYPNLAVCIGSWSIAFIYPDLMTSISISLVHCHRVPSAEIPGAAVLFPCHLVPTVAQSWSLKSPRRGHLHHKSAEDDAKYVASPHAEIAMYFYQSADVQKNVDTEGNDRRPLRLDRLLEPRRRKAASTEVVRGHRSCDITDARVRTISLQTVDCPMSRPQGL